MKAVIFLLILITTPSLLLKLIPHYKLPRERSLVVATDCTIASAAIDREPIYTQDTPAVGWVSGPRSAVATARLAQLQFFTSNEESRHAPTRSYDGKCVINSETNVLEELDEEIAVGLAPDGGRDIPKDI